MAVKCRRCVDLHAKNKYVPVRIVPAGGRASNYGLCCKCDRILNGRQSAEDRSEKVEEKERRKKQYETL